jgi:hypothetical protein
LRAINGTAGTYYLPISAAAFRVIKEIEYYRKTIGLQRNCLSEPKLDGRRRGFISYQFLYGKEIKVIETIQVIFYTS